MSTEISHSSGQWGGTLSNYDGFPEVGGMGVLAKEGPSLRRSGDYGLKALFYRCGS